MNDTLTRLIFTSTILFTTFGLTQAQDKKAQNTLQSPPANITIDGDLKDWGDSLRYYNEDKKIYYSLANDKDNLYMAIRINDRSEQARILHAGFTLSIDPRGKKKEAFSVTFPLGGQQTDTYQSLTAQEDTGRLNEDARDEQIKARLTRLREIKVTGFKDVESDMITTSNTYGFKTAIDFDKDGNLIYELAIPLKFFHADDLTKNEWAFNFRINGISKPSQNHNNDGQEDAGFGGRGGRMGGGMGGGRGMHGGRGGQRYAGGDQSSDHSEMSKPVDFWEKFYLAK